MRGQKETILAVAELARIAGASCSFKQLPGGHLAAVLGFNGRIGKVILSSTTRDRNERHIAKRYTRRVLRLIGAVS